MEQYYSPQKSARSSPFDSLQTHLNRSHPNKSSSFGSPYIQRSSSIDPECLSPLPLPSSKLTTPLRFEESPQSHIGDSDKSNKEAHLGKKLKVKVFNIFQDKNEVSPLPVFEEEATQSSMSTSAGSPQLIELTQNRSSVSQSSSASRAGLLNMERSNSNTIDEFIAQTLNSSSSYPEESRSNDTAANDATQVLNADANGVIPNSGVQAPPSGEANVEEAVLEEDNNPNFADSLEFMLDKTPVITIFMSLVSLSLISGIIVSFLEGRNSHRYIFIVIYVYLIYLFIEKTLKMFKAYAPDHPTLKELVQGESFYKTMDTAGYIVIAFVVDLQLSNILQSLQVGLYFHFGLLALYCSCSCQPSGEKFYGVFKRTLFILQLIAVMGKLEGDLTVSWKVVLCSGWIVLGVYIVRLLDGAVQVFSAISEYNILRVISKTSKIITIVALFLLFVDLVVLMMILVGVCKVLDAEDDKMDFLKSWLTVSQYLNAFLLFFTTIAGADLFEFVLTAAEYFNPSGQNSKPREFITEAKETLLLRMSPTYYKVLEEDKASAYKGIETSLETKASSESEKDDSQVEEDANKEECKEKECSDDNMCYICCGKEANGVILDCGHGGICFECLTDYINKKSECMECRKRVNTILKIEKEVEHGRVFKGEEICKVVRVEE